MASKVRRPYRAIPTTQRAVNILENILADKKLWRGDNQEEKRFGKRRVRAVIAMLERGERK